jgi:hypothetical protein
MQTRRYWISSTCFGPRISRKVCPCFSTFPACWTKKRRMEYSVAVSLTYRPLTLTTRALKSTSTWPDRKTTEY